MVIRFLLSCVEVRLISITKLALQVMHNGSTICMQISTFAKTGDLGPLCKNIIAGSILLKAFESRNEEVCNKNCSYRPMKGEQKHILYKNIETDIPHLAAEQFISIHSIRTLFFGRSNMWNHMFQMFLKQFECLASPV